MSADTICYNDSIACCGRTAPGDCTKRNLYCVNRTPKHAVHGDVQSNGAGSVKAPYVTPEQVAERGPHMTTNSLARKETPIASGVLDYFPAALADIARLSKIGNDKHNPGQPLHWARHKSTDHADCIIRHMLERGTIDTDGLLHDAKVAWRALAQLQVAIERLRASGVDY